MALSPYHASTTRTPASVTRTQCRRLDLRRPSCSCEASSGRVAGSYPTRSRRGCNHSPAEGHRATRPAAGSGQQALASRRPVPGGPCLGPFARYSRDSRPGGKLYLRGRVRFSPAPAAARNGTSRGGDCGRRTLEGWGRRRRRPWLPLVAVGAGKGGRRAEEKEEEEEEARARATEGTREGREG